MNDERQNSESFLGRKFGKPHFVSEQEEKREWNILPQ